MRIRLVSLQTIATVFGLTLAVALLAAAQQTAIQPYPANGPVAALGTPASVKAEDYYKNIQVLKGVPADQIVPMMEYMRSALGGVRCQYCHNAPPDFAGDDKPQKRMGRKMLQMVMDINKGTFGGGVVVTCYTCHRGSTDPVNIPAVPDPSAEKPAATDSKGPALPAADAIVAKYIDALGGEQALRKVTSRVVTGTLDIGEVGGAEGTKPAQPPFELDEKAPNLTVLFNRDPKNMSAAGFDGTTAWLQNPVGQVGEAFGPQLARAKRTADLYEPLDLKQEYSRMTVSGVEKIGDRDAYKVIALPQGELPVDLYFDTQTGLLLRKIFIDPNAVGDDPTNIDYSDYRATPNGVKFPYTIKSYSLPPNSRGAGVTMHVQNIQENVPIDDSKFAKPAAKPAGSGN
jgi:photosynthetic reaction center cytochrome c subunit